MANSFTGTNSALDPNRTAEMEARQRVNLGTIQDKGLAKMLASDVGAQQANNSYGTLGVSNVADLNEAAKNYSVVDQSGWLDQYKNDVNPYIVGRSSINKNVGYTVQDYLDEIEGKLSTTAVPEGFTRKGLDNYKYELLDNAGASLGEKYYGVDDVLRNQYRGQLGQVSAATWAAPLASRGITTMVPWDEGYSNYQTPVATPEQRMWETFLQGRNQSDYAPTSKLKANARGYQTWGENGISQNYSADDYETIAPTKTAYNWGDVLYDSQDAANAAREAQIMGRPSHYRNLMEKYEAAGEGGMGPQNWKGNYGADNAFSGASAISQLGGDAWMKVDPKTGKWSSAGYKIDPNELTPEALRDFGYTQYVEQGKQQKKGGFLGQMIRDLSGGLSVLMPDQFNPMPYDGKRVTEYGGNQVWRDYGSNTDALKALMKRTPGGALQIDDASLSAIPEFYNRNTHDYNTKSENIVIPNTAALRNMTIAGTMADIFFPQFTWGGGAAGAKSLWAEANKEATGQSSGDIAKTGLKNWGTGALTAYLGSSLGAQGADLGGTLGASAATAGDLAQTMQYANYGAQAGKAIGSGVGAGLGSATGNAIGSGSMSNFGKDLGSGALKGLVSAGVGAATGGIGAATGIDSRVLGALGRLATGAGTNALLGKKTSDRGWLQLALNSAMGAARPLSSNSKYSG